MLLINNFALTVYNREFFEKFIKNLKKAIDNAYLVMYYIRALCESEASSYDPLAQSVEHLAFNQGVRSSSLRWITTKSESVKQTGLDFCLYEYFEQFELFD